MAHRLSRGLLESQLEALDLCSSLFPQDGELTLSDETERFVPALREWVHDETKDGSTLGVERDGPRHWENEIAFVVHLALQRRSSSESDSDETRYPISLSIKLPTVADTRTSDLPPPAIYYLNQPAWLARTAFDSLSRSLPQYNSATFTSNTDFVLSIIDHVRDRGPDHIPERRAQPDDDDESSSTKGRRRRQRSGRYDDPEYRVWLWFPSLSTREKRDDIVNHPFASALLAAAAELTIL